MFYGLHYFAVVGIALLRLMARYAVEIKGEVVALHLGARRQGIPTTGAQFGQSRQVALGLLQHQDEAILVAMLHIVKQFGLFGRRHFEHRKELHDRGAEQVLQDIENLLGLHEDGIGIVVDDIFLLFDEETVVVDEDDGAIQRPVHLFPQS